MKSMIRSCGCVLLLALIVLSPRSGFSLPYPFSDDFEGGLSSWSTTAPWGLTDLTSVSPSHSVADSPGAYYGNNTDASLVFASAVNLSGATRPALSFRQRYEFEEGWDEGVVEISTNGGSTWLALTSGTYTGSQPEWMREQLELVSFAGMTNVKIRFRVLSDASVTRDGWHIDNVRLGETPAAVTLGISSNTANTATLGWNASAAGDFAAYRIYRSTNSNDDWRVARLVAEIRAATTTGFVDTAICPKTRYFYQVMVITTNDLHRMSNVAGVMTAAGMDFPFRDDAEAGGSTWVADVPWSLSTESAVSPSHAWSDSPGGDYGSGVNASLTLAAPMNLLGSRDPILFFNQQIVFLPGDFGCVDVSTNNGASWMQVYTTPSVSSVWARARVSLAAFTNSCQVLTRFRVSTDASGTLDGWHLDDITACESPSAIPVSVVSDAQAHSLSISWQAVNDDVFAGYAVFRGTNSAVDMNSTQVAFITDRTTTNVVDLGLAMDTTYFYRVYAVNSLGAFSVSSPLAGSARTIIHPLPFTDGFEGSLMQWTVSGQWGSSTNNPASGSRCVEDSPGLAYSNSLHAGNNGLQTSVSLAGTDVPVLKWRDRYNLAVGDYGYLEVSPDGGTWSRLYCAQGGQTNWSEHEVNLLQWKGQANLRIRFWLSTDGGGTAEGWALDDVAIENRTAPLLGLPFHEEFEAGLGNWIETNLWGTVTNNPYSGSRCVNDRLDRLGYSTERWLSLAGKFDLSGTTNPVLVFWYHGAYDWYTWFGIEVSWDGGMSWATPWALDSNSGPVVADWTRVQVSLAPWRVPDLRVRFKSYSSGNPAMEFFIDKMTVEEAPPALGMNTPVPHLKTMDVSWSASSLGGGFGRYLVYRSPDPTVDALDRLVGVFSNSAMVSMTDTNLNIGALYYYGVYVVDTNDVWVRSSNVVSAATVPTTGAGFSDSMDSLAYWDTLGSWGVDTVNPYSGAACVSDSPGVQYANSLHAGNNGLQTAVSLAGTDVPVLKWRDRCNLAVGDYGYLEVSPDGGSWFRLYCAQGGQTNWSEHEVNLLQWKGQANLRIRFWLSTDGSGTAEGWALDDVAIENRTAPLLGLPFHEEFEAGLGNWIETNLWGTVTNNPYSGSRCVNDRLDRLGYSTERWLSLAGKFDLSGTTNPVLVFWYHGAYDWYTWFGIEVSWDGGMSWATPWALDSNSGPVVADWTRVQVSLAPWRVPDLRVRFKSYSSGNPAMEFFIDKMTVEEAPPALGMNTPVPHLKTMDVSWSASGLGGAFQRYLVYRSMDGAVDTTDLLVGSFTNPGVVSMTDSNLNIGSLYYYGVYAVDTNDVWVRSSNVVSAATVPMSGAGFTDGMETLAYWDTKGGWGVDAQNPYSGAACVSDSPGVQYANGLHAGNNGLQTAMSLAGTDVPVLKWRDRYNLAAGDYGYLEVSPDGGSWFRLYCAQGGQTNWSEHEVNLVQWKGQANLRIRFWLSTDGSGTDEGWALDNVSIENRTAPLLGLPFHEEFEGGLGNWIETNLWGTVTNSPYSGARCVNDRLDRFGYSTERWLSLAGKFDLSGTTNPVLVFWYHGAYDWYTWFGAEVSWDGGMSWATPWALDSNSGPVVADWTRIQVSLSPWRVPDVRIRFKAVSSGNPAMEFAIDKVTVEEAPPVVGMNAPVPHLKTMDLSWTPSGLGGAFSRYLVYRSLDGTVDAADSLVGSFTNAGVVSMTDSNLNIGNLYYYGVYVVDTNDVWVRSSNVVSVATVPMAGAGFADGMESLANWDAKGGWGVDTVNPYSGSACVSDSPGMQYANSLHAGNNGLQTALSLAGMDVPVLRWHDRYSLAAGDYGYLEVSPDGGTWYRLYCVQGGQTNWSEHEVSLMQWKGQANLRIRVWLSTDGSGTDEGWALDDVMVENRTAPIMPVPFLDGFETGMGTQWIEQHAWGVETNNPHTGYRYLQSKLPSIGFSTEQRLTLEGKFNLSTTVNPALTFWYHGSYAWYTWFGVEISTDGGVSWGTLWALDSNSGPSVPTWTKISVSLVPYRASPDLRIRFKWSSSGIPPMDFAIDDVGIGDGVPGVPLPHAPADGANVNVLHPVLWVTNAPDGENDLLTYRYEVYSDAQLSNVVAQVPEVAGGSVLTGWTVDTELQDLSQYWWRCRARDATSTGAWSSVSSFFVNLLNIPPTVPVVTAPLPGSIVESSAGSLVWRPSSETNSGDRVALYHVQVDTNRLFTNPAINDSTIPVGAGEPGTNWIVAVSLQSLAGVSGLQSNQVYYWRVRAGDTRGAWSDWSSDMVWFYYGIPAPDIQGAKLTAGSLSLDIERTSRPVYIEHTTDLVSGSWEVIAGPFVSTNVTVAVPTNAPSGFFRVVTE